MTGHKTYLVAGLALMHAGLGWYLGYHGLETALELAFAALGLGTLRHGMTTEMRRAAGAAGPGTRDRNE